MVGNAAVRIELFIYRLVCANGLLIKSAEKEGRVIHSGKRETFTTRIAKQLLPISSEVQLLPKLLEKLMSISFNLERLVDINGEDLIYKIIPLDINDFENRKKLRGNNRKQYDIDMIKRYTEKYVLKHSREVFNSNWRDNQSMYDFINIFTEYANSLKNDLKKKIEIERNTGEFVNWIIKNENTFNK